MKQPYAPLGAGMNIGIYNSYMVIAMTIKLLLTWSLLEIKDS